MELAAIVDYSGIIETSDHCFEISTTNKAQYAKIKAEVIASAHQLVTGHCSVKDRALTTWTRHGVTVIEYGEEGAASQDAPFLLFDKVDTESVYSKIANEAKLWLLL